MHITGTFLERIRSQSLSRAPKHMEALPVQWHSVSSFKPDSPTLLDVLQQPRRPLAAAFQGE